MLSLTTLRVRRTILPASEEDAEDYSENGEEDFRDEPLPQAGFVLSSSPNSCKFVAAALVGLGLLVVLIQCLFLVLPSNDDDDEQLGFKDITVYISVQQQEAGAGQRKGWVGGIMPQGICKGLS